MKPFLLLLSLLSSLYSFSQSSIDATRIKKTDQFITANFGTSTPGCALLIAQKGKILLQKGYGTANIELKVPMRADMNFRIGSITKQFTAMAILQLMEEGKLSLRDPVGKYITGFNNEALTIEHLLSQTSGLIAYEKLDAGIPNAMRVEFSTQRIVDTLKTLPLNFTPGSRFEYCNSNYYLLGYIIEKLSGRSYAEYIRTKLVEPLGLKNTSYESPTEIIPNRANGYYPYNNKFFNSDYISMSLVYSAGALRSTTSDLYQWNQALFSYKLLKKETIEKAIRPYPLSNGTKSDYGYGLFIRNENNNRTIGHGGAIDGFRAWESYYPDLDLYIVLLCNSDADDNGRLFQEAAQQLLGQKTEAPAKEIQLSGEILNRYVGTYKNEKYKVSIRIYRANGRIYGDLSNGTGSYMMFMALTETSFLLPDITRIKSTAQFIVENGKAVKLIMTQEGPVEFVREE